MKVLVALFTATVLAGCVAVPSGAYYPAGTVVTQCRPPYVPTYGGGCVLPPTYYYHPAPGYYSPYGGFYFYYHRHGRRR